jgi:hypothetical protein
VAAVVTRWSSTLYLLDSLLKNKSTLIRWFMEEKAKDDLEQGNYQKRLQAYLVRAALVLST